LLGDKLIAANNIRNPMWRSHRLPSAHTRITTGPRPSCRPRLRRANFRLPFARPNYTPEGWLCLLV
jgi:hypothetical protein